MQYTNMYYIPPKAGSSSGGGLRLWRVLEFTLSPFVEYEMIIVFIIIKQVLSETLDFVMSNKEIRAKIKNSSSSWELNIEARHQSCLPCSVNLGTLGSIWLVTF